MGEHQNDSTRRGASIARHGNDDSISGRVDPDRGFPRSHVASRRPSISNAAEAEAVDALSAPSQHPDSLDDKSFISFRLKPLVLCAGSGVRQDSLPNIPNDGSHSSTRINTILAGRGTGDEEESNSPEPLSPKSRPSETFFGRNDSDSGNEQRLSPSFSKPISEKQRDDLSTEETSAITEQFHPLEQTHCQTSPEPRRLPPAISKVLGEAPIPPAVRNATDEDKLRSYPLNRISGGDEDLRAVHDKLGLGTSNGYAALSEDPVSLDVLGVAEVDEYQENPFSDGHEDPFVSSRDPSLRNQTRESPVHSILNRTISRRSVSRDNIGQAGASASPKRSAGHEFSKRSVNYGSSNRSPNEDSNHPLSQQQRTLSLRTGGTDNAASCNDATSARGFASGSDVGRRDLDKRYFRSRRVRKADIERPWLDKKDPREKWLTIIPVVGILVGLCIAGVLVWDGMRTVINHDYCEILDEDFSNGLDPSIWKMEAEVGGFGNGQFEETTITGENVFIDETGTLVIRPTLQDPLLIDHDSVVNLTQQGICSSPLWSDCVVTTNTTNGTIVNPVKSGRLSTKRGPRIRYGRVEVTATLPSGDWLWPAIWMMPVNTTYGPWPASGELDIAESRGNNYSYPQGGNNVVGSTMHWGPAPGADAWWRTTAQRTAVHGTYAQAAHVFGLEWSESYVFTYVDSRLLQVLYFGFGGDLWALGAFPPAAANGSRYVDPWSQTGRPSTPFDTDFYLILNLAVGATNGWFEDGVAGKPWVDASTTARRDFWDARDAWYPTWANNGDFRISRVRMWQQQGYNGC